jgi:hypothetical protein
MKTIITSPKGLPLPRVLCSFLFGAAAFCIVPLNIQAGDIVWVTTTGNTIAKYNADGNAINAKFIVEPLYFIERNPEGLKGTYPGYLGPILVSGSTLYVDTAEGLMFPRWEGIPVTYLIATYIAGGETGNVIKFPFFAWPFYPDNKIVPLGMALSGSNLYVATEQGQVGSVYKIVTTGGGNTSFIPSGPEAPYALAVNGLLDVLYVTNNAANSNGDFYISTYTADTGALINANFIQIATGGLYGLALKGNILYVSVYSGSAPGVYTYKADTGELIKGPLVSVNEPWGIAIEGNTLYVVSNQDAAIYEFDLTKTPPQRSGSIKVSGGPTNITVEPADKQ